MKSSSHIRSLLAGFLLLVFCLGITPKQLLHNLCTNHKHVPGKFHKVATIDRVATKYVCDIHDQVAESHFISTVSETFAAPVAYLRPVSFVFKESLHSSIPHHTDLRGPPALA